MTASTTNEASCNRQRFVDKSQSGAATTSVAGLIRSAAACSSSYAGQADGYDGCSTAGHYSAINASTAAATVADGIEYAGSRSIYSTSPVTSVAWPSSQYSTSTRT